MIENIKQKQGKNAEKLKDISHVSSNENKVSHKNVTNKLLSRTKMSPLNLSIRVTEIGYKMSSTSVSGKSSETESPVSLQNNHVSSSTIKNIQSSNHMKTLSDRLKFNIENMKYNESICNKDRSYDYAGVCIKQEKLNDDESVLHGTNKWNESYSPFENVSVKQEEVSKDEEEPHFCNSPLNIKQEAAEINPSMFVSVKINEGGPKIEPPFEEKKIFRCDTCGRVFSARPHLVIHIRSVHNHEKPFVCPTCGTAFAHRSTLTVHVRGHTGEKPFSCDSCGRKFTKKGNLNLHLQVHSGIKPYVCSVCAKAFARPNNLMEHMRVHTGERAHICSICEKSFSSQSVLNRHKRLHKKKETVKCERCNKSFSRISYLSEHQRIHTGEKPYQCKLCGETFMHRGQVYRHKQIHKMRSDIIPILLRPGNPEVIVGVPIENMQDKKSIVTEKVQKSIIKVHNENATISSNYRAIKNEINSPKIIAESTANSLPNGTSLPETEINVTNIDFSGKSITLTAESGENYTDVEVDMKIENSTCSISNGHSLKGVTSVIECSSECSLNVSVEEEEHFSHSETSFESHKTPCDSNDIKSLSEDLSPSGRSVGNVYTSVPIEKTVVNSSIPIVTSVEQIPCEKPMLENTSLGVMKKLEHFSDIQVDSFNNSTKSLENSSVENKNSFCNFPSIENVPSLDLHLQRAEHTCCNKLPEFDLPLSKDIQSSYGSSPIMHVKALPNSNIETPVSVQNLSYSHQKLLRENDKSSFDVSAKESFHDPVSHTECLNMHIDNATNYSFGLPVRDLTYGTLLKPTDHSAVGLHINQTDSSTHYN